MGLITSGISFQAQEKLKSLVPLEVIQKDIIHSSINPSYNMVVKLMKKLELKNRKLGKNHNPFLPPFEEGIFLNKLQKTHNLLFNKFPLYENHVLVITRGFEF